MSKAFNDADAINEFCFSFTIFSNMYCQLSLPRYLLIANTKKKARHVFNLLNKNKDINIVVILDDIV